MAKLVPGNSGQAYINAATASANRNAAAPQQLCTWDGGDDASPLTLYVSSQDLSIGDAYFGGGPVSAPAYFGTVSGTYPSQDPYSRGLLAGILLEYSTALATRRVAFDLKPGIYQLPPCTYARARLLAFPDVSGTLLAGLNLQVAATLAPGLHTQPARAVVTHLVDINAAPYNGQMGGVIPPGARWFDVWGTPGPLEVAPAAGLQLVAGAVAGLGAQSGLSRIVRDYVNNVSMPSWGPVELGVPGGGGNATLQGYAVVNDNYSALQTGQNVVAQFYLEL